MKIVFIAISSMMFVLGMIIVICNLVAQARFRMITGRFYSGNSMPSARSLFFVAFLSGLCAYALRIPK